MSRNLLAAFLMIVLVPLGTAGALGWKLAREDDERARDRAHELMRSTLRSLDDEIHTLLGRYENELRGVLEGVGFDAGEEREQLRRRARGLAAVRQVFVVNPLTGELLHPSLMDDLDTEEEAFLDRTRALWTDSHLRPGEGLGSALQEAGASIGPARGWYPWFQIDGLHLIFWWRTEGGQVVGAEFGRVRLLADVVAMLPDTDPLEPELAGGLIRLLDSKGDPLYQWGSYSPPAAQRPAVRQVLRPPLAAWSLDYLSPGVTLGRTQSVFLPPLLALASGVILLAVYFYRESSREMRDAAQRVSFVNQVSHELKTPLTNIRMYAELLGEELDEDDGPAHGHAGVIISESQRLSRLILNILTFSRKASGQLALRKEVGVVDDTVACVLEHFRPAFDARGIEVRFEPGAGEPVAFDRDKVEQILGNLMSNVEKYAASGKRLDVTSRRDDDEVVVTVADYGPGIAPRESRRIFKPFYRISNALTDGVTGTGIGLAIARELARLHGGDLALVPSASGARFQLTLKCPGETT